MNDKIDELHLIYKMIGNYGFCTVQELLNTYEELQEENKKYKEVIEKLKDAIEECWYMDSENIGDQVFLKKIELQDILKEAE